MSMYRAIDSTYEAIIYFTHLSIELWLAISRDFEHTFGVLDKQLRRSVKSLWNLLPPFKLQRPQLPTLQTPVLRLPKSLPKVAPTKISTTNLDLSVSTMIDILTERYTLGQLILSCLAVLIFGSLWLYILAIYII